MARGSALLLTLLVALCQLPAQADVVSILDTAGAEPAAPHPDRFMTMEQVEAKFGAPREKIAPVGDPPITRWVYDDYTVYFENQQVLHIVIKH
jgi:hypothetical protein